MGMGVYGGKDFWKRYVFSSEWKSEGVMDGDSGDSEEDEGEEDWLRQGWRSETGSLFRRVRCWVQESCVDGWIVDILKG